MIRVNKKIAIDEAEINEDFILSSGPGGQNVNKVCTAVKLYFNAADSTNLDSGTKRRLLKIAGRHVTKEGVVVIDARAHRTREGNRREALKRLVKLIDQASIKPKKRRPTKPTRSSKERRLKKKKAKSEIKRLRQNDGFEH